jgi:DNA adenine methylase
MPNNPDTAAAPNSILTPIFRWAGSKRKLLPKLQEYWKPEFTRYVEPFAGSAALFFRVRPTRALLGDINPGLIEAYQVIRDRPDDVHRAVSRIPISESQYYTVRKQCPRRLTPFSRAVRFVYLNRHCFNGIYRTNSQGEFNVPYAHSRPGAMPSVEDFRRCALLLQGATLRCSEFGRVLSSVRDGDFVYLDPPYAVATRRVFREYDRRIFSETDLDRLVRHLKTIDAMGAKFVVSYADCGEARRLLKAWKPRRVRVRRHIAGFVSARRLSYELLATNIKRG